MNRKLLISVLILVLFISVDNFIFAEQENANTEIESSQESQAEKTQEEQASSETEPIGDSQERTIITSGEPPYASTEKFQVEPSTGTATLSIPIEVVPGRKGIQPSFSLMYNSSSPNGILGVGWNLELGSIQRSTKKGAPKYDDSDTFVLVQGGSTQELVNIGGNEYRAKIEGAFMKFEFISGSYWLVTDKKGIKYYFGQFSDSRVFDAGKVFKWLLSRVQDLHGNYMQIEYCVDQKQLYPQRIYYTGNFFIGDGTFAEIEFSWDSRDDSTVSYRSGFAITTAWRCNQIDVKVNGQVQRSYKFNYDYSASSKRSNLTSITQYGADGISFLPATTFTYQTISANWNFVSGWNIPEDIRFGHWRPNRNIFVDEGARLADVNGDGFTDVIRYKTSSERGVYINNKTNGWYLDSSWTIPDTMAFVGDRDCYIAEHGVRLADVNADGFIDFVKHYAAYSGTENVIYLNNKTNGWNLSSITMPSDTHFIFDHSHGGACAGFQQNMGVLLEDVNADGFVDIVKAGDYRRCFLNNNGNGWVESAVWAPPSEVNFTDASHTFADVNGDGLVDIVKARSGDRRTYINNGAGWTYDSSWNMPDGDFERSQTQLVDINADGLADVVIASESNRQVYLNNGHGWSYNSEWANSLSNNSIDLTDSRTRFLDADGDGLIDLMRHYNFEGGNLYINGNVSNNNFTDLLSSVDNGIGATTEVSYVPSTQYDNTGDDDIPDLPFPIQTVSSVTATDQVSGQSYTTNYEYKDGLFDFADREFRGFGYVKVTDVDGNYTETHFLQEAYNKGRARQQASHDSYGNLYNKVINDWQERDLGNGSKFIYLSRADNYSYGGDETFVHTATESTYDDYGNVIRTCELGDVDTTGDERYSYTDYVYNESNWLVSSPKTTYVKDNLDSTIVKQFWFYYDDNQSPNDPPTHGFLTKQEDWLEAGDNPTATFSYDSYGNFLTTTDAFGRTSTVTYDSTYHIFPLVTENTIGHQAINEYYGVNGVPLDDGVGFHGLWGQRKSTTDPNGNTSYSVYDSFGRTQKQISSEDSIDYPTTSHEYDLSSIPIKIISHQREISGQYPSLDSVSFYDGLGRLIQAKTETEELDKFIVSGQTEYNLRGLPEKKYLPKFSTNPIDAIDSIDPTDPHSTITYDAMGRVIQATNPDGTYSTVQYDDLITTTIDENGHMQKSYSDVYGRLVKKEEYLGADGRSLHYDYQTYTLYATTYYFYDTLGNLIQTKDAHENITTISYDTLGRKTSMIDPDMGTWTYEYDKLGNLIAQTDSKGQIIEFDYDEINRLVQKSFSDGTTPVDYTYDDPAIANSKGRLTKANYAQVGDTKFEYDALGREVKSIKKIDSIDYQVQRSYDAMSRLLSVEYPDQGQIFYSYNNGGQIESVTNSSIVLDYQTKLLLHSDGIDGTTNFLDSSTAGHAISAQGGAQIDSSEYKFGGASGFLPQLTGNDSYTKLLLHANGADGSTNFIDSSLSGHAVSVNGDAKIDTAEYQLGGSSAVFDGSGDYLSIADSADWYFDGDFTIDFWYMFATGATTDAIHYVYCQANNDIGSTAPMISIYHSNTGGTLSGWNFYVDGTATIDVAEGSISSSEGVWEYLACVKNGTTYKIYRNGVEIASTTNALAIEDAAGQLTIGANINDTLYWDGWLDEVRVSKGIARWISDFIPPELEYGDVGSYLTIPDSPDWNFGEGDFSIDFWVKFDTNVNNEQRLISQYVDNDNYWTVSKNSSANGHYIEMQFASEGVLKGYYYVQGWTPTVNTWYHLAFARNETNAYVFINGVSQPLTVVTALGTNDVGDVAADLNIGRLGTGSYFSGWMDEVRVSKGIARWTSNFTPPQEPYTIESGGGGYYVENVDYNASGQIVRIEYGNGDVTEYTYDSLTLRLIHLVTTSLQEGTIQDLSYEYDSVGNIIQIIDAVNTASQAFQYDELNRLVVASGAYGTKYYDYDEIGNMTLKDGVIYSYGEGEAGPHAITSGSDGSGFEYDLNGNMVKMIDGQLKMTNYVYDSENRLKEVFKNNKRIAAFEYDGDGGRTNKKIYKYSTRLNSSEIPYSENKNYKHLRYVLEFLTSVIENNLNADKRKSNADLRGYQICDHLRAIGDNLRSGFDNLLGIPEAEAAQTGTVTVTKSLYVGSLYEKTSGSPTKHIFLGSQRICSITNGGVNYFHSDHLGSTNVITNNLGIQTALYEYKPYGEFSRKEESGSDSIEYFFTGKKLDDETGLYYYGARYYNPLIGRFITPDSIVQNPYNPQSLNRYSYCLNNPINRIDPSGHWSWKKFWNSFAGAFLGAVITVLTAGAGAPFWLAGMAGGFFGGALTGGLEGGGRGALFGGLIGGALGGLGGWGFGIAQAHQMAGQYMTGMLIVGAGVAGTTDNWDSFAGGFTGGLTGAAVGNGIINSETWKNNAKWGKATAEYKRQIKAMHDLNVDQKDTTVGVISRPLEHRGRPGSLTGPRHDAIKSDRLPSGKWEMGPNPTRGSSFGKIVTTNTVENLNNWGTHITTEQSLGLGGSYARSFKVDVNFAGLEKAVSLYESTFGSFQYNAFSHNSNFAVNSVIYGAGGDIPFPHGIGYRGPGFPTVP